mmetsp:Transcript_4603/g.6867  ORF Transcript_4603/g.6867 Transcript_4603/m.6867 type:complete len:124 (-) Transcript_4603:1807-2178(-)
MLMLARGLLFVRRDTVVRATDSVASCGWSRVLYLSVRTCEHRYSECMQFDANAISFSFSLQKSIHPDTTDTESNRSVCCRIPESLTLSGIITEKMALSLSGDMVSLVAWSGACSMTDTQIPDE